MNGYVQDERYIAGEHMDVRRDCVKFAQGPRMCGAIVSVLHGITLMCGAIVSILHGLQVVFRG